MLFTCPECSLPVSDRAVTCPHCGYPLSKKQISIPRPGRKRRRLPNGFGSIDELSSGNLRNRFRVRVTTGTDPYGKPIRKLLKPQAYFPTYNKAYEALVEYNKNPYDLDDDLTVKELYERWTAHFFPTLASVASERAYTTAWAYCSEVYDMRVRDIRAHHIKACMENGVVTSRGERHTASPGNKHRIKSLFNIMLDYALEYELVDKNYARTFTIPKDLKEEIEENRREHISFTDDEMVKLKQNINLKLVDVILIQCYMGWRPQELGLLETENVDLEKNTIVGGMKTDAGTQRTVPIHPYIRPLIEKYYRISTENHLKYLISYASIRTPDSYTRLTYDKYTYQFKKIIQHLGLNHDHRPHDPRKQFVTMCKKYKVDEYAIKMMVGHQIDDITEAVYTDRPISWLIEEINKIE